MTRPSVGAIGAMAYDGVSDRVKGLFSTVLKTKEDIVTLLKQHANSNDLPAASRFTIRVFTGPQITEEELMSIEVPYRDGMIRSEAFIEFGFPDIGGLAYFGCNTPDRGFSPQKELDAEQATWRQVKDRAIEHKQLPAGYTIEVLENPSNSDIQDLREIYAEAYSDYITPLTAGNLEAMCRENFVVIARNGDKRIVAVSQGEIAELTELDVTIIELTETASLSAHRGLSTHIKQRLVDELKGPRVIIYAETRCGWGAVQRSNYVSGAIVRGRLERHCRIASDRQDFKPSHAHLGNLFVMHWPYSEAA